MLRSLRIEHFRGVRSAEVTFDRTTVLIGENDSGMASILEALALALSPADGGAPRFAARDFRLGAEPAPICIALTFTESEAVTLKMTASPSERDEVVDAHWEIRSDGGRVSRDNRAGLAAVRRLNPLVRLRHGALLDENFVADEAAAIVRGYDSVLRGGSDVESAKIESGIATTKRLLGEWIHGTRQRTPQMRAMVTEILASAAPSPAKAPERVFTTGSAAQRMGVFMFAAKLLKELASVADPGVSPILLVEEPEAHVHPMTLASIVNLLELFTTQKIITTQSGGLLGGLPLQSMRRVVRNEHADVRVWSAGPNSISRDELRKVGYHLRARRSVALFARTWLLVEGETEFWVMPDLARLCGYDLAQEGVACVEFAQSGLVPIVKLANRLGIAWHVLTDGDRAGNAYVETIRRHLVPFDRASRLTRLRDLDIEHTFWHHGYAAVFERLARMSASEARPRTVIRKAIERHSKPAVAFELLAAVAARGSAGPPPPLANAIEACVRLARGLEPPRTPNPRHNLKKGSDPFFKLSSEL